MSILPHMVGQYQVVAQLGQGGMARALLAIRQGEGGFRKLFVVKQLRLDMCENPSFIEMFLDEARLAALLNHPNVVQAHEIGGDANSRFISMDYLEGQPLGRLWHRSNRSDDNPLPLRCSVHVLAETLAGLHYAHDLSGLNGEALSVVHRDISPGNIFVTYDGRVKLLDFGIAKASDARAQTGVGILKGKLAYMAPEQAQTKVVDRRADVFAVGVLLWEAMARRRLVLPEEPAPVTLNNRINGKWTPVDVVSPGSPPELVAICNKAMALDREDRFQTAKEFRSALLAYLSKTEGEPPVDVLSEVMCDLFSRERKQITDTIARAIAEDRPTDFNESNLDSWNMATLPTNQPDMHATPVSLGEPGTTGNHTFGEVEIDILQPPAQSHFARNAGIGMGVCVVAAAAFFFTRTDVEKAAEPPAHNAQAAAQPENDAQPATVSIVVSAAPSNATILLDGEPISNPFVSTIAQARGTHTLEFSAEGYETVSRTISYERDGEWKLALTKLPEIVAEEEPAVADRKATRGRKGRKVAAKGKKLTPAGAPPSPAVAPPKPKDDPPKVIRMGEDLAPAKPKKTREIDRKSPYQ